MKKIIKGAFQKFVTDCQRCGCQFEYGLEDVLFDRNTGDGELDIFCPDCGFYTPHHSDEGIPSSRKKVEPEKPEEMGEGRCAVCRNKHPKLFLDKHSDYECWLCEDCYNNR